MSYHLQQQHDLREAGWYLPRSSSTLWRILDQHHVYPRPRPQTPLPFPRPQPLQVWELDFTDIPNAAHLSKHKQQHVLEACNIVDRGTSMVIESRASDHYDAEYALVMLASAFVLHGLPQELVIDRDPRLVGSGSVTPFPSALLRFALCLGVRVTVLPAHRPDLKPFVERYHRSLKSESLRQHHPQSVEDAQARLDQYRQRYHSQRPHQSLPCANRPPALAFPLLPALPQVPPLVDPEGWLQHYHQHTIARQVSSRGTVQVGKHRYYIGRAWAGQRLALRLDSEQRQLVAELRGQVVKTLALKGLSHSLMSFADFFEWMCEEARSEWKQWLQQQRLKRLSAQR